DLRRQVAPRNLPRASRHCILTSGLCPLSSDLRRCRMRLVPALVLAAGVVQAAGNPTPADDKKPDDKEKKKMTFPDLNAKDWKKQPNGLEIWDVKEGKGDAVKAGGTVTVHYTGWLTNGKQFDSSVGGKPVSFPLNRVIKGWTEG